MDPKARPPQSPLERSERNRPIINILKIPKHVRTWHLFDRSSPPQASPMNHRMVLSLGCEIPKLYVSRRFFTTWPYHQRLAPKRQLMLLQFSKYQIVQQPLFSVAENVGMFKPASLPV